MPTLQITAVSVGDAVISVTLSLRDDDSAILAEAAFAQRLSIAQPILDDIRWYLEDFLEDGSGAAQIRANGVRSSIQASGIDLFRALFCASRETEVVWAKTIPNLRDTRIEVEAKDLAAERIPWEMLRDPETNAPLCLSSHSFVRSAAAQDGAAAGRDVLESCRVLLIISRPSGEADVAFRSIALKVYYALQGNPAFEVTVLRPPSFSSCAKAVRDAHSCGKPFDIVHFDGHGFHEESPTASGLPAGGYVVFEDEAEPIGRMISGAQLGGLLSEGGTAAVILNACQSAFAPHAPVIEAERRAVGSFAHDVLRAGVPFVVAMRYSVYVSSARRFMEEFYRQVARGQRLSVAGALARKVLAIDGRIDPADGNQIDDWLVPLIFQRGKDAAVQFQSGDAAHANRLKASSGVSGTVLPPDPDLGFIGSDNALLSVDRAFDTNRIVLLYGLAGSGKTAASVEFGRWYGSTTNPRHEVLFTSFENSRSLDQAISLAIPVLRKRAPDLDWVTARGSSRRALAIEALRNGSFLWIWDSLEVVEGFGPAQRAVTLAFLRDCANAGVKVLLTSRNDQRDFLAMLPTLVPMPPLRHSESIEFARALAQRAGRRNVNISLLVPIIDFSKGNPLSLMVTLSGFLSRHGVPTAASVGSFVAQLEAGETTASDDPSRGRSRSLTASLQYGFESVFSNLSLQRLALLHLFRTYINTWVLFLMGHDFGILIWPSSAV